MPDIELLEDADDYFWRGRAYYNQNNYDTAIENFTKAMKLSDTEKIDDYFWRGRTYCRKKDYDAAINDLTKAMELREKENASDYYFRGLSYYHKKKYDFAIEDFTKAMKLKEEKTVFYLWRGRAYYHKKDYDAAINDLTKLIELRDEEKLEDYYFRGNAYYHKEKYDEAMGDTKKALEIKPDYKKAEKLLSKISHQLKMLKRISFLSTIEKDQVYKGVVKNVVHYGAFIDIGDADGLLHISEMSKHVKYRKKMDPKKILQPGQEIEVIVLDYDAEKERISFGIKQVDKR
jgi:tetratricopeptide (TPR) repeat protein